MDDPLQDIARILTSLRGAGTFAAHHRESAQGLCIEVVGVGTCRFPLSASCIESLVEQAVPSPFGHRDRTVHDASVRDSWEIPADRVQIDPSDWAVRMERAKSSLAQTLGFPPTAQVDLVFQKLVIYQQGQFFAPHRDTEKRPSTSGTLVVVLPSVYEGGEVLVSHAGEQITLDTANDGSANQLAFLGFYADCLHEIRPVHKGSRVALTFSMEVESDTPARRTRTEHHSALRTAVDAHLEDRSDSWLVHLLEHQYSHDSISWSRLKNGDRERADALREVAAALDCHCMLALVEAVIVYPNDEDDDIDEEDIDEEDPEQDPVEGNKETEAAASRGWAALPWPSEPDASSRRSLTLEESSDAGGAPSGDHEVTILHWIDEQEVAHEVPDFSADDDSVTSAPGAHWSSHSNAAEPWTGNEGGYAAQWYHLSAVLLVPRGAWLELEPVAEEPQRTTTRTVRRRKRRD